MQSIGIIKLLLSAESRALNANTVRGSVLGDKAVSLSLIDAEFSKGLIKGFTLDGIKMRARSTTVLLQHEMHKTPLISVEALASLGFKKS